MSAVATSPKAPASRRDRAAETVEKTLAGGLLGAAVAGVAWLGAWFLSGTIFLALAVATVAVALWTLFRGRVSNTLWAVLAAGWIVVLVERWAVHGRGGLFVAAAAWVGLILGARRAGIRRRYLPLLAFPLVCIAIAWAADVSLTRPFGTSWIWVAAVLGPVFGVRTLLGMKHSAEPE
jgi:hypothetical protein